MADKHSIETYILEAADRVPSAHPLGLGWDVGSLQAKHDHLSHIQVSGKMRMIRTPQEKETSNRLIDSSYQLERSSLPHLSKATEKQECASPATTNLSCESHLQESKRWSAAMRKRTPINSMARYDKQNTNMHCE